MQARFVKLGMGLMMLWVGPVQTWGHGPVHLQIKDLTQQIAETPDREELYLRRGELYRLHQLWDAALADFESARTWSTNQAQLDFLLGRLYLEAGWPETARTILDRFIKAYPEHAEGHLLKARAWVALDRPLDAAEAFGRAIELSDPPSPGYYVERARAQAAAGPEQIPLALQGLDQGMAKLGPLVTLQLPAIELELKRRDYDHALERLDRIASLSPRKETWLKRRGDILGQAGRTAQARQAYQAALDALNALPPARRYVPAMVELEEELLAHLKGSEPAPPSP